MSRITRRKFMKRSLAAAGGTFVVSHAGHRVLGANERIRAAVAGIHGRGGAHIGSLAKMKDVEVAYLIDPDSTLFERRAGDVEKRTGRRPKCVQDIREALDDKDLHAVSIATCNHWHCLITIWACQAGKDVYVEKPLSHTVHEGRICVEAARKHKRVVQYGTGAGSTGDRIAGLARAGTYGKLLVSRGLCYKRRGSIGFEEHEPPPEGLDFDVWTGPAPKQPYHENLVHYDWHWFWDFGNGDIGNQGSHQMHAALHAVPDAAWPRQVMAVGGRFSYTDQGETANTQIAVFDYGQTQVIFEVRGLKTDKYLGQGVGNTFHFEEGVVAGGKFYPKGDTSKPESVAKADVEKQSHGGSFGGFIDRMRRRDIDNFLWNLETAHYSSGLCHLGNISYRLGKDVAFGSSAKPFGDNNAANETFERMREHLKDNGLDLAATPYRLGRHLTFDGAKERFVGDAEADRLLTRPPRPPFAVPESV